ncbi:hypothetical protein K1719_017907 [Acacia pycnantha]|nr:hypothetical protein K1719_017907 [Acacia pycnantha]
MFPSAINKIRSSGLRVHQACTQLKKVSGRRAAEVLMQLAPHDSGAYVALSNTYAAVGDRGAVAEVRLKMKDLD